MRNNFGGWGGSKRRRAGGGGVPGVGKLQIYFNSEDYSFSQSIINKFKSPNHSHTKPPHSNQREENPVGAAGVRGYFQAKEVLSTWIEAEASQASRAPSMTTSQELPHSHPTVAMAAVRPPKTVPTRHGETKPTNRCFTSLG